MADRSLQNDELSKLIPKCATRLPPAFRHGPARLAQPTTKADAGQMLNGKCMASYSATMLRQKFYSGKNHARCPHRELSWRASELICTLCD